MRLDGSRQLFGNLISILKSFAPILDYETFFPHGVGGGPFLVFDFCQFARSTDAFHFVASGFSKAYSGAPGLDD